jgi:8-amino-7-oxononanoate synthase
VALDTWLDETLQDRRRKNLFRELKITDGLIDFCSNDYLGLARSDALFDHVHHRLANIKKNGATGSRLISGNSSFIEEVEEKLARIFKSESALLINSGYTGNLAILSSIPQKNDTILYDELAHASIKDGARLSLAKRFHFKHNDLNDLESKIKRGSGKIFIVIESIYSMDGDECPLTEITQLATQYGAFIILDEAHSTGTYGIHGSGLAVDLGVENMIDIRLYTFGKAMGTHGACIAGSKKLKEYLINFARPFIYTTAPTPHSVALIDCAFDFLKENISLQNLLEQKVNLFLKKSKGVHQSMRSKSAIQTVLIPGNENVKYAAQQLQNAGFDIRPIVSPTVPTGLERLRICVHTYNSDEEIERLTTELKKLS